MIMLAWRSLLLCGAVTLAGCGTDPVFSDSRQLGAFELTHRDGVSLPQAVSIPWPRSTGYVGIHSIDGGSLQLESPHDYRLSLSVMIQGKPEVIVLGEGEATFTLYTVMLPLADGRTVTGSYGPTGSRQTITLFLGERWGTLTFTRSNSLSP
jgi:hypothetical protein